jgi:nucleoside-diphosphate-sugar epimerase
VVFGEQFWRPYCHAFDLARACICVLTAARDTVDHNVFNVGDTKENYQKKMIVDDIRKVISESKVKYVHKDEDPRDYKVDFSKISSILGFQITMTIPEGIQEIKAALKKNIFPDPDNAVYGNI